MPQSAKLPDMPISRKADRQCHNQTGSCDHATISRAAAAAAAAAADRPCNNQQEADNYATCNRNSKAMQHASSLLNDHTIIIYELATDKDGEQLATLHLEWPDAFIC
eukprot:2923925-Amphidinium_carterae.1